MSDQHAQVANTLETLDLEPPMGDLFSNVRFGSCRSMWVEAMEHERRAGAPERRIIHAMSFQAHGTLMVKRLGVRPAPGYHKCGSRQDRDWVVDLRILVHRNGAWEQREFLTGLSAPGNGEIRWVDLAGLRVDGALFEVRRCGIDDWWTPWNLAAEAFILESAECRPAPRKARLLELAEDDGSLPVEDGNWLLSTGALTMTSARTRSATASLHLAGPDTTGTERSLLYTPAGSIHQGVFHKPVGTPPVVDETVRCDVTGTAACRDSRIYYNVTLADGAVRYEIEWRRAGAGLALRIRKEVTRETVTWESAAWRWTFDTLVSPSSVLGPLERRGRTGLMRLPALLHLPRYGSLLLSHTGDEVLLRSDTDRPRNHNRLEIKLGEEPGEAGSFIHRAGTFEAEIAIAPVQTPLRLRRDTPEVVHRALERVVPTAFTFRPDTGTLSNNGASMHCPICMDNWAGIALRVPDIGGGIGGSNFLRYSLERWLDGGPGYASGVLIQDGKRHLAEDEYLMTGSAALLGLGMYLESEEGHRWAGGYLPQIREKINAMAERDLDNDGLIESPYRTGVSGTGQWSTCWLDVLSFGWKDAFANALLYAALRSLARGFATFAEEAPEDRRHGDAGDLAREAARLDAWAESLSASYYPTFYNPETGWLAGWRCKEGKLHDYAFLQLNGAAVATGVVDPERGRSMLEGLLKEIDVVGMPDPVLGMPGNLRPIPDEDRADIIQGFPMGYYQNGGRTHAQTKHFLDGLYAAGLSDAADALLERLCSGLAAGYTYGGNQSGIDWRYWDDRPCGYEGLLTDQFGLLATALRRYGL